MHGKKWVLILAALLAAKGAGILPQSRGLEERKLISALAVDGGEETTVTAVTGVQVSEGEKAEVLTGKGGSLAQACRALRGGSARRVYLGQVEQLLVGEGQDLGQLLDFVMTDRELRLDTLLYIVKGRAGEALAASAERVAGETGGRDPRSKTAGWVLPRLAEGEYALVPALALEEGALTPAGWAVLGPGGLEGYFEEEAAVGAELLAGKGEERVVTLPGGAAELTAVRTWTADGTVYCTLTGRKAEGDPKEEDLAAWGRAAIEKALEPGWDCWGLDREQGALRPEDWPWLKGYPIEGLRVEVTGKLVKP